MPIRLVEQLKRLKESRERLAEQIRESEMSLKRLDDEIEALQIALDDKQVKVQSEKEK